MEYIGKIENDKKLFENEEGIVIFGAGEKLKDLLLQIGELHIKDKVVCICDNSCKKQGQKIEGIEVCRPGDVFKRYKKEMYIVYNQYSLEICQQLIKENIDKIHLIRR